MMDKAVIQSTEVSLRDFKESTIWADMVRELRIWDLQIQTQYDACKSMEDVTRIQGRREALAYIMQLPDILLEGLIKQREEEKKNE